MVLVLLEIVHTPRNKAKVLMLIAEIAKSGKWEGSFGQSWLKIPIKKKKKELFGTPFLSIIRQHKMRANLNAN